MAITYNSGTNTITITGYTLGTPCTFLDVYNADVAGSWGKVTNQCTNQFCIACKIVIGDGSRATYFADEDQQVKWTNAITTANYQNIILVKTNGSCRFGKLIDGTKKITRVGCQHLYHVNAFRSFFINCEASAELLIYASSFIGSTYTPYTLLAGLGGTTKIYNSNFNGMGIHLFSAMDMYNVLIEYVEYGIYSISGTVDTAKVHNTSVYGLIFYNTLSTLKNTTHKAKLSGSTIRAGNVTGNCYLINPELESWDISWGGTGYPVIYRQYEFDLKLVDSVGTGIGTAKVKMWDKDDSLVTNVNTNASGVLATQTLNHGYYQQSSGSTETVKTPHESRVYKYGKSMLSSKSSIEAKTDWALTMLTDDHITQTTEATVAAYTGITINHTTETITISTNHTLDEIYDYCQYDMIAATKQLDQTVHTSDGVNFISEYSFVVNTGITVTATDQKLSMIAGETYTLSGTAQFTGVIVGTGATINKQISLGTDDGTESNDVAMTLAGTLLNAGHSSTTAFDMGLRWQSVNIAQGTSIISAKLSVYVNSDVGTLSANIRGIDEDNTVTWATDDRPSQRTKTTATITANEANWTDYTVDSWAYIDITSVIQEIINRGGWSANNALAVVIEDTAGTGENYIAARAYEYAGNLHGAKLDIVYGGTTTRIPVKLTNIIDGSRYWVGKDSDGSTIFEGTQSGSGTVTGYYEHTANIDIDIRVRKSSASLKYKPWVGEGTLSAEAFSLRIRQILDSIIS